MKLSSAIVSKAFVKEDDAGAGDPDADEEELERRIAAGGKRYITPAGFKRVQEELAHLWNVERPKVTQEVADAAAQGDRSENAEYIYGKKRLREIDRRVRYLSKLLDRLTVVEPSAGQRGRAFFGAWVTVEAEDGTTSTYRIVGPDETDVDSGAISLESPMGKALLGKAEGDEVVVVRPKGRLELTVIEVRYEPPRA